MKWGSCIFRRFLCTVLSVVGVRAARQVSGLSRRLMPRRIVSPLNSSMWEMSHQSDLVVIGTTGGQACQFADWKDSAQSQPAGNGIPMVLFEVEVSEILLGHSQTTIRVAVPDN